MHRFEANQISDSMDVICSSLTSCCENLQHIRFHKEDNEKMSNVAKHLHEVSSELFNLMSKVRKMVENETISRLQ